MNSNEETEIKHFKGKDAIGHVVEAQAQGIISTAETHSNEMPGHISAAADSARDTAIALGMLSIILSSLSIPFNQSLLYLALFSGSWLIWKAGRSAWLGWSRLERLHRIVAQEKWEIEHHRQQERDELRELYAAKGFEGKLLEDVLDVLMADGDRLLRVMVEEELGLSLGTQEHPLKQSIGSMAGTVCASMLCLLGFFIYSSEGLLTGGFIVLSAAAFLSAWSEHNRIIAAIIWNLGISTLVFGFLYFLIPYFFS